MSSRSATAISCPNIAFIKYWGNRDDHLRIPSTGSISMNLDGLETRTCVQFNSQLTSDSVILNGVPAHDPARQTRRETSQSYPRTRGSLAICLGGEREQLPDGRRHRFVGLRLRGADLGCLSRRRARAGGARAIAPGAPWFRFGQPLGARWLRGVAGWRG